MQSAITLYRLTLEYVLSAGVQKESSKAPNEFEIRGSETDELVPDRP